MRHYEVMVILDPDLEERTVAPSLETFLNVVKADGGSVDKVDIWGRRRLAYEIKKKTEGIYAVAPLIFDSAGERAKLFVEDYQRAYGDTPDLRAAKYYEAAQVVVVLLIQEVQVEAVQLVVMLRVAEVLADLLI